MPDLLSSSRVDCPEISSYPVLVLRDRDNCACGRHYMSPAPIQNREPLGRDAPTFPEQPIFLQIHRIEQLLSSCHPVSRPPVPSPCLFSLLAHPPKRAHCRW